MSALFGHVVGVLILVMMAVFIGIWFWAWRPRHKDAFDSLAQIPMLEGPHELHDSNACETMTDVRDRRTTGARPANRGDAP